MQHKTNVEPGWPGHKGKIFTRFCLFFCELDNLKSFSKKFWKSFFATRHRSTGAIYKLEKEFCCWVWLIYTFRPKILKNLYCNSRNFDLVSWIFHQSGFFKLPKNPIFGPILGSFSPILCQVILSLFYIYWKYENFVWLMDWLTVLVCQGLEASSNNYLIIFSVQ